MVNSESLEADRGSAVDFVCCHHVSCTDCERLEDVLKPIGRQVRDGCKALRDDI